MQANDERPRIASALAHAEKEDAEKGDAPGICAIDVEARNKAQKHRAATVIQVVRKDSVSAASQQRV